jgi:soluble lytic murein transglycosylase-like protein
MTTARVAAAILAAVSCLSLAAPSNAQITTYVDGSGKLVFVNSNSRAGRSGSTISSLAPSQDDVAVPKAAPRWPALPLPSMPQGVVGVDGAGPQATPAEPPKQPEDRLDRIVREAAERNKVDPALVKAVISTESGWNPRAVSSKGAVGLMQLVPPTAQRYGVNNSFDPAQNVEGGTKYLRSLLDRYNGDLTKALAAYNAGERTVDVNGGVPAIPETQRYVRKVTDAYFQPGSGRNSELWSPPKSPVRREVDSNGRVVFTNE